MSNQQQTEISPNCRLASLLAKKTELERTVKSRKAHAQEIAVLDAEIARVKALNPLNIRSCTIDSAFSKLSFMLGTFYRKLTGDSHDIKKEHDPARRAEMERVQDLCVEFEERVDLVCVPFADLMDKLGHSAMYAPNADALVLIEQHRQELEHSLRALADFVGEVTADPQHYKTPLRQ